jgi:hypothetical protein
MLTLFEAQKMISKSQRKINLKTARNILTFTSGVFRNILLKNMSLIFGDIESLLQDSF